MFKVKHSVYAYSRDNKRYVRNRIANGSFTATDYSVAKQIQASLNGICFDNPDHEGMSEVYVGVHSATGIMWVDTGSINALIAQLQGIEEEITRPSDLPSNIAAE